MSASHLTPPIATTGAYSPIPQQRASASVGLQLARIGLQQSRRLMTAGFSAAFLTGVVLLVLPKTYSTTVSFAPAQSALAGLGGSLGGLASQFNVSLPGVDAAQSPDFYAALITTPDIDIPLVTTPHQVSDHGRHLDATFMQLYDIAGRDSGMRLSEALRAFKKVARVEFDRQTSVVRVTITTEWRDLSYQLAVQLLQLVNEFNLRTRQEQSADQQRFLGERVAVARAELRNTEDVLKDFLLHNRQFQTDPSLLFAHDRLDREVRLRQDVYTMLTQAYEQAKVESLRNTPVISVVEHPAPALRADRRGIVLKCILAFFGGAILWYFLAVVAEALREARASGHPEAEAFFSTADEMWSRAARGLRLRRSAPARSS